MFLKGERETILNYDPETRVWHAYTSYWPHIQKFKRLGWSVKSIVQEDGQDICGDFYAPQKAVTIRNAAKLNNHRFLAVDGNEQDGNEELYPCDVKTSQTPV